QGAVRPGTCQRNVEVIAAGLGLEAVAARRARAAIGRDPVAELCVAAYEAATRACRVIPLVMPFTVYQKSHFHPLSAWFGTCRLYGATVGCAGWPAMPSCLRWRVALNRCRPAGVYGSKRPARPYP